MSIDVQPLKDYLLKNIIKDKSSIFNDDKLFSSGLVDSFGTLDLIFFIKEQYGKSIEDYDIADNNTDTFDDLVNLINSKD